MLQSGRGSTPKAVRPGYARILLLIVGTLTCSGGAVADQEKPWSVELSAGAEYDSNVAVSQLDVETGEGDAAATFDLRGEYEWRLGKRSTVDISYDFSQVFHSDLNDFDRQIHTFSTGFVRKAGALSAGADYSFAFASLGGEDFLRLHRVSPFLQIRASRKTRVRLLYVFSSRSIEVDADRDADSNTVGADFYYFISGSDRYLSLGYRYEDRNATGPEFDFTGRAPRIRFVTVVRILGARARLTFGYRHEDRSYDNPTPSIGVVRADDRDRYSAKLEVPFSDRFTAISEIEYRSYRSNLPTADYSETIGAIRVAAKF